MYISVYFTIIWRTKKTLLWFNFLFFLDDIHNFPIFAKLSIKMCPNGRQFCSKVLKQFHTTFSSRLTVMFNICMTPLKFGNNVTRGFTTISSYFKLLNFFTKFYYGCAPSPTLPFCKKTGQVLGYSFPIPNPFSPKIRGKIILLWALCTAPEHEDVTLYPVT